MEVCFFPTAFRIPNSEYPYTHEATDNQFKVKSCYVLLRVLLVCMAQLSKVNTEIYLSNFLYL